MLTVSKNVDVLIRQPDKQASRQVEQANNQMAGQTVDQIGKQMCMHRQETADMHMLHTDRHKCRQADDWTERQGMYLILSTVVVLQQPHIKHEAQCWPRAVGDVNGINAYRRMCR